MSLINARFSSDTKHRVVSLKNDLDIRWFLTEQKLHKSWAKNWGLKKTFGKKAKFLFRLVKISRVRPKKFFLEKKNNNLFLFLIFDGGVEPIRKILEVLTNYYPTLISYSDIEIKYFPKSFEFTNLLFSLDLTPRLTLEINSWDKLLR